jgi:hypothetical protein
MRKDIAMRWVKALRSGKYQQTRGALHRTKSQHDIPEGYCCLGVLADLADKSKAKDAPNITRRITVDGTEIFKTPEITGTIGVLPEPIIRWAGMRPNNHSGGFSVDAPNDIRYTELTQLNDSSRLTFEQIADIIEANYEYL